MGASKLRTSRPCPRCSKVAEWSAAELKAHTGSDECTAPPAPTPQLQPLGAIGGDMSAAALGAIAIALLKRKQRGRTSIIVTGDSTLVKARKPL